VICENFVDWMQCREHSINCALVISENPICRDSEEECNVILSKPGCEAPFASSEGECIWLEGNVTLSKLPECALKVIYLFMYYIYFFSYLIFFFFFFFS
jgi:hypothetical protein